MSAREEIEAALAAMRARLDAASVRPWQRAGGFIDTPNASRIASVLYAGRYADAVLIVAAVNDQQRVIDHVTDVLARHTSTHQCDGFWWTSNKDYRGSMCKTGTCPEVASVHAMVVGP